MTIPTAEQLEAFRDFIEAKRPDYTNLPNEWELVTPPPGEVSLFCSRLAEARNELLSAQYEMPFFKWLRAQPHYVTARTRAFKSSRSAKRQGGDMIPIQQWLEDTITRALNERSLLSPARLPHYQLSRVWHSYWWEEHISECLHEYFYGLPPSKSYKQACDAESLAADMDELLKRYQRLANESQHVAFSFARWRGEANQMHRRIERITDQVRRLRGELPKEWRHPIKRNDGHAKERLLVYRFWQAHRRHGSFPASAVTDLTCLEGIANSYDQRSIEKMYASYTGTLRQETA